MKGEHHEIKHCSGFGSPSSPNTPTKNEEEDTINGLSKNDEEANEK
jgi:hypothetical protein